MKEGCRRIFPLSSFIVSVCSRGDLVLDSLVLFLAWLQGYQWRWLTSSSVCSLCIGTSWSPPSFWEASGGCVLALVVLNRRLMTDWIVVLIVLTILSCSCASFSVFMYRFSRFVLFCGGSDRMIFVMSSRVFDRSSMFLL